MPSRRHKPNHKCKTGRVARDPPPTIWQTKKLRSNLLESKLAASRGSAGGNQHHDDLAEAALQPPQAGPEFLPDDTEQAGDLAVPERLSHRHVGASHPQPSAAGTNSSSSPALEDTGATARRTVLVEDHATHRKLYHQTTKKFRQLTIHDSSVPNTERDKANRNKLNRRQDIPSTGAATQIPTPDRQEQQPAPAAPASTMRTRSASRRRASGSQLPQPANTQPPNSAMPQPGNTQPASSAMPQTNPKPAPIPSLPSIATRPPESGPISNLNNCPVCDERTVTRQGPPALNNPRARAPRSRITRNACQCHFTVLPVTGLQERMDTYFAANPVSQMTPEEVCEFFTTGTSSTNPALNALGLGEPW